jgi:hypothetical protein
LKPGSKVSTSIAQDLKVSNATGVGIGLITVATTVVTDITPPSAVAQMNVIIHGGTSSVSTASGGSLLCGGCFVVGGVLQVGKSISGFSWKKVTPKSFGGINKAQGNVNKPSTVGIPNPSTNSMDANQGGGSQVAFVGGAVLSSGWAADGLDPEPFSKVGGTIVMTGVSAYVLYQNRAVISNSAVSLYNKMTAEIDRIAQKAQGPQGFQYAVVAEFPGLYPNVRGGTTFLNAGDVWKYGKQPIQQEDIALDIYKVWD